ncbi:MAG: 1-(5-phosphoribosyl)-5-[(5-phosphoribosylamino)methylideneamino]imidazole-4-carboxamide isomerase [Clostridia bacterium]
MMIYPSIDILEHKCVRLEKGRYDRVTVYPKSPLEYAAEWESLGARYIHVVDLDGARTGSPSNAGMIGRIAAAAGIPVQAGGGIRSMEAADRLFESGVQRIILGTSAVKNPDFLGKALEKYGDRIVIGIDAKDGFVAVDGWENKSTYEAVPFARMMQKLGIRTVVYTDVSRDGMLTGPNLEAMKLMAVSVTMDVIASGGVGKKDDVDALRGTGVSGVIIGKALYEGKINLKEIINADKESHSMP